MVYCVGVVRRFVVRFGSKELSATAGWKTLVDGKGMEKTMLGSECSGEQGGICPNA